MKPSGIVSFYNVPADAEDPDVKVYVNNELVETGGGGGGDFSTCTVTPGANGITVSLPVVDEENNTLSLQGLFDPEKVVLYKGSLVIPVPMKLVVIDSGDAVYDSENEIVTITGDCQLSIGPR